MLNKCPKCKSYTIGESCADCKSKTESAHYKFPHLRDADPSKWPEKEQEE